MKFTELKREILSDGSILRLSWAGNTYTVLRSVTLLGIEPEIHNGLRKRDAENLFIDYLRNDVLEIS